MGGCASDESQSDPVPKPNERQSPPRREAAARVSEDLCNLLLTFKVSDYDRWRTQYDGAFPGACTSAGPMYALISVALGACCAFTAESSVSLLSASLVAVSQLHLLIIAHPGVKLSSQ